MNSETMIFSEAENIPDRITGESINNPYARTLCRNRKITPSLCDGTCWNCKKEREEFSIQEPHRMRHADIIAGGGDPDIDIPDISVYQENIQKRIEKIESQKKAIIQNFQNKNHS